MVIPNDFPNGQRGNFKITGSAKSGGLAGLWDTRDLWGMQGENPTRRKIASGAFIFCGGLFCSLRKNGAQFAGDFNLQAGSSQVWFLGTWLPVAQGQRRRAQELSL